MKLCLSSISLVIALLSITKDCICQPTGRNVNWIHGIESNDEIWDRYEEIFQTERLIRSFDANYSYSSGIVQSGAEVNTEWSSESLNGTGPMDPSNLAIGHDIGGLVSREIDRTYTGSNRRYGGIITTGSPNRGAYLFNSFDNGDVEMARDEAIYKMTNAIVSSTFGQPKAEYFVEQLIDGALNEHLLSPIEDLLSSQVAEDLSEGATLIEELNEAETGTPTISIWGKEQSPVHWRLASSLKTSAADDNIYVKIADEAKSHYRAKRNRNIVFGVLTGFLCILALDNYSGDPDDPTPILCAIAIQSSINAIEWQRGVHWLKKSESYWTDLIGCNDRDEVLSSVTYTVSPYLQYCGGYYTGSPEWIECIYDICFGDINGPQCAPYEVTYSYYLVGDLPSDGLCCQHTQIVPDLPPGNIYTADGVNHREETNTGSGTTLSGNDEMRDKFNEIWVRVDIFNTPVR